MWVRRNIHKLVALSEHTDEDFDWLIDLFWHYHVFNWIASLSVNSRVRWDGPALQSLRRHCIWFPLWSACMRGLQGRHLHHKTNDVHDYHRHAVWTKFQYATVFGFFFPGFFSPQHSAEHQLQDVCEEWELSHHAHEPQPVPALPLQEMPVCGHVARWWDIPTFNERFSTVLWSAQSRKEKRSPKAAQRAPICRSVYKKNTTQEVFWGHHASSTFTRSRWQQTCTCVSPLCLRSADACHLAFFIFSLVSRRLSPDLGTILHHLPIRLTSEQPLPLCMWPTVHLHPPPSDDDLWEEEPWSPQSYLSSRKTAANIRIILGNWSRVSSIVTCTPIDHLAAANEGCGDNYARAVEKQAVLTDLIRHNAHIT